MSVKSSRFCFTANNYTELDLALLNSEDVYSKFKYICWGKEVGESGTPHLQGFFMFENKETKRFSAVKKLLEKLGFHGWHIESCKGSPMQNVEYCSKQGDFTEYGERPKGQGKRTDLDDVCQAIKEGATMVDLIESHPAQVVKFHRGLEFLIQARSIRRSWKTEVWWLWGPTGSGKSRYAWAQCPEAYMKCSSHKWWSGYIGQDTVILDDYRPSKELPFNFMLNLMDRYPMSVETKGGMTEFIAKRIYVTCPYSPEVCLNHLEWIGTEQKEQFLRRIDHTIQFPQLAMMYWESEETKSST